MLLLIQPRIALFRQQILDSLRA